MIMNAINSSIVLLDHMDDTTAHVTSEERTAWNGKASVSSATASLTVAGWTDNAQTVSIPGMTADANGDIGLAMNATAEQVEAAAAAMLLCTATAAGTVTVTAFGTVPTVDIPIQVTIVG